MDKIAVLIPCYNESKTVEKVVTDFRRVLPDHSGTENRQIFIRRRIISKHTIQFLGKTLRTSDQTNQTIDILLHRPEILPTVTFANMRSIVIRTEGLNKISFIIYRLHEA